MYSTQVNIASTAGDMGILSNHVPAIVELKPGVMEVVSESGNEKYFVSGGFATMQPGNVLSISAVEAYKVEDFATDAVRNALNDARKVVSGRGSNEEVAEAKIEVEFYDAPIAVGVK